MNPKSDGEREIVTMFRKMYEIDPIRFKELPGVTTNWSPDKLMTLWSMLQDEKTQDEIAEEFDVDRSTISRKDNSMIWHRFIDKVQKLCKMSQEECVDEAAVGAKEKMITHIANNQRRKVINTVAMMQHIEEKLVKVAARTPKLSLPEFHFKNKPSGTPEEMVLVLSDAHVGQKFTLADTGGLGEYNPDMFLARMHNLRKGLLEIYNLHSKLYQIPKLHILCLGDMVQGGNFNGEWGPAYTCLSVDEQVEMAANATAELILSWEPLFKEINFVGVVGNHGRGGVSKNSDKVSANWDNMVYAILDGRMREHKAVKVERTRSWWAQRNINGTEVLAVHGDYIGGNVTSLKAEEQRFQALVAPQTDKWFNILCLGHFHTHHEIETPKGMILVNGSFVGGDIHAMQHMRTKSAPTQTLFGVHPERGMTWKYHLNMDLDRAA